MLKNQNKNDYEIELYHNINEIPLTPIENSCRVAEVLNQTFEVALPLFWTKCEDNVVADQWYYNTNDKEIYPIPESAPYPD